MADKRSMGRRADQAGSSHLYLAGADGKARALPSGKWEVSQPALSPDGRTFHFVCNREWPGDYEVCAVPAAGGDVREVTALDGVEGFELSPRGDRMLVTHSASYLPIQLAVANADGSNLRELTDTRRSEEHTSELQSLMRNSYAV